MVEWTYACQWSSSELNGKLGHYMKPWTCSTSQSPKLQNSSIRKWGRQNLDGPKKGARTFFIWLQSFRLIALSTAENSVLARTERNLIRLFFNMPVLHRSCVSSLMRNYLFQQDFAGIGYGGRNRYFDSVSKLVLLTNASMHYRNCEKTAHRMGGTCDGPVPHRLCR